MTRTTITKFAATALAVASLGVAGSAPALAAEYEMPADQAVPAQVEEAPPAPVEEEQAEQTPEQNIAIGEPPPGTVPPGTKVDPVDPETTPEEEVDYNSPEYFKSKEADDRYDRYCKMTDAEPSHSDKKFCEDYDKAHGTGTGSSTGGSTDTGSSSGGSTSGNPSTGGSTDTGSSTDGSYGREKKDSGYYPKESTQPVRHSSGGSLPFTGLEIWQLGLLAMVLIGGGLAARRLLVR